MSGGAMAALAAKHIKTMTTHDEAVEKSQRLDVPPLQGGGNMGPKIPGPPARAITLRAGSPKAWKWGLLVGALCLVNPAQAWTITNINIGTDLNSAAWGKVNNNNNTITGVLNAQAVSNGWFAGQISNALATATVTGGNLVQSSYLVTLTNINPLTFTGSNYIGQFSQFFSFALGTPLLGGGGMAPPTNQFEQVWLSYNGTAWFALTNAGGAAWLSGQPAIFQNVRVAVVGAAGNAGSLVINGLNATNLWNHTNSLVGQVTLVSVPVNPADAASKQYVDAHAGTVSPWVGSVDTNAVTHCSYGFNGLTLADLAATVDWIRIDGLAADGTGTNLMLTISQTNLVPGWAIRSATNLLTPMGNWLVYTNYTVATNSGELSFTIPINFTLPAQFFLAEGTGSNWVSVNAPMDVAGALTEDGLPVWTNGSGGLVITNAGTGNNVVITNGQVLINGFPALTNNIHVTGTPTISTNVGGEYARVINANGDQGMTLVIWFTNAPAATAGTKILTLNFAHAYATPPCLGYTAGLSSDGTYDGGMRPTLFVWGLSTTNATMFISSAASGAVPATGKYYTNYVTLTGQ